MASNGKMKERVSELQDPTLLTLVDGGKPHNHVTRHGKMIRITPFWKVTLWAPQEPKGKYQKVSIGANFISK